MRSTGTVDDDHAALKDKGVAVEEPMVGEGPVPRLFFLRDPDGNSLLLVEETEG
jgi:hypothetical protein